MLIESFRFTKSHSLFLMAMLLITNTSAQKLLTPELALQQFNEINKKRVKYDDPIRSFEESANRYFKQIDLLPHIDQPKVVLDFLHYSGYNWHALNLPEQAIETYDLFFEYYKKFENQLSDSLVNYYAVKRSFNYGTMATNYIKLYQIEKAEQVHRQNIEFIKGRSALFWASALNNYGLFLIDQKADYDHALKLYLQAKQIIQNDTLQQHFYGSIVDNIADVYRSKDQYDKAIALYKENFERYFRVLNPNSNKYIDYRRLVSAGCQLIDLAYKTDQMPLADSVERRLRVDSTVMERIKHTPDSRLEFLATMALKSTKQGDYRTAYNISETIKKLSDSLEQAALTEKSKMTSYMNNLTLERIRSKFALEKAEKETKIISQRKNLWIVSLAATLVLCSLLFLLYRRRKKMSIARDQQLLAEKNLELSTLKNEQLKTEIELKKRDLSDFALNLSQSQEWARTLAEQMKTIKESRGRQRSKLLNELENDIDSKVNFDNHTQAFYERLDKLNAAFYQRLNENYSQLSKTERRLCSLIRLDIDSHEIANLQNISLASLNTARYRLRKKLNLNEDQHLDHFIQSL